MKRAMIVFLIFYCVAEFLSAQTAARYVKLSDIFTSSEIGYVKDGKFITYSRMAGKGEVSNYNGAAPFVGNSDLFRLNLSEFTVVALEKYFIKADAGWGSRAFNALTDTDKLNGMKYYSRSESGVRALITGSWKSSAPSWIRDSNSVRVVSHFVIKDNRLGTIPFNNELSWGGNVIVSSSISSAQVSRFGLKIFDPGDYRVYKVLVYDKKSEGWFYYSAQFMRVRSDIMKTLDLLKPENICNRVRADTVHFLYITGIDRSAELAAFR